MLKIFYRILRSLFGRIASVSEILAIRFRYEHVLRELREKTKRGEKLRVAFVFNENAKWKAQTLFDLMKSSDHYSPFIALTLADIDWQLPDYKQKEKYESNRRLLENRGMEVVEAYSFSAHYPVALDTLKPDIVFYQQPWAVAPNQMPAFVSYSSLTCYIPYFVANYGDFYIDCSQEFHRQLWRYFILNRAWERCFGRRIHCWTHAGKLLGLGHPGLDNIMKSKPNETLGETVIYAPHWSISVPGHENFENYSTFLWTGRPILDYAKAHPEIKWVFKPHPTLRQALHRTGVWSDEEIDRYYDEWGRIGTVCQTGDYQELFLHSKCMITDCGSFLTEYFSTGKPLIHLISPTVKLKPLSPSQKMFDSFYKVHKFEELEGLLDQIVYRNSDPKLELRKKILSDMGLDGALAAEKILKYLDDMLYK